MDERALWQNARDLAGSRTRTSPLPGNRPVKISCFNMAESRRPGTSGGETNTENQEYDARLDFFSAQFDPLEALRSDNVKLPQPKARTFDNIAKWKSHVDRGGVQPERKKPAGAAQRRWQEHQLPVQTTRPKKERKNVFTRMESFAGPFAAMRKYVAEKSRIKIVTRDDRGVRGVCTATLLAFDKHWNLLLENAEEIWKRKRKTKTPLLESIPYEDAERRGRVRLPETQTVRISKNTEQCRRFVRQMIMRGEDVVLVCLHRTDGERDT
ncbi:U7 snRNA-associated Sm-like protein LSm11 [Cylas formicarius]|uniref:U7 snRNA-associated Sm-like protein LSm11 n=1 Tax=Cylas formicarius TaxID=197179 RepID=UPI002958998A|nr:U7 snRNA-associated Sm-like protein LSm11 [Cylas formicarius]